MITIEFGNATIKASAIIAVGMWERIEMDGTHSWSDVQVAIPGTSYSERFWNTDKDFKEKSIARRAEVEHIWRTSSE